MSKTITLQEYFARTGSRFSHKDAQKIGPELAKLAGEDGVDASQIVKAAKPKRSPLHPFFEWDDSEAARLWREEEARDMARSIVVRVEDGNGELHPVRAFHAVDVTGDDAGSLKRYVTIATVQREPDYEEQVVETMKRRLAALERDFGHLRSVLPGPLVAVLDAAKTAA